MDNSATPACTESVEVMATDISDFVYTVKETAALLKLSERTIRRYIRQGKLKAYRVAGERELRIKGRDLLRLLEPIENPTDHDLDEETSPLPSTDIDLPDA